MSLEFAIIPITDTFVSAAYTIQSKLKDNVKLEMYITIDTNYEQSFASRINKWKKKDYDIITIDSDFDESNSIVVRFSDKGSRAQSMEVEEFIDLVSSFEDETNHNNSNEIQYKDTEMNDTDGDQDGGCTIM